jgi:hypothetical protein
MIANSKLAESRFFHLGHFECPKCGQIFSRALRAVKSHLGSHVRRKEISAEIQTQILADNHITKEIAR